MYFSKIIQPTTILYNRISADFVFDFVFFFFVWFRVCCCGREKSRKKIASWQNENHSWIFVGLQIFLRWHPYGIGYFSAKQHGKIIMRKQNPNADLCNQLAFCARTFAEVNIIHSHMCWRGSEREREPIKIEINTLLDIVVFSRFICVQCLPFFYYFFFSFLEIMVDRKRY